MVIDRPNHVWCADITYIPMHQDFMYLAAVMDWYSRRVLSWRVSNILEADFCVAALEDAIDAYGPPEIFNPTKGANSRPWPLPACSRITISKYPWTGAEHGWTTYSSNAYGGRSSMNAFTSMSF
jgi:putative transposase